MTFYEQLNSMFSNVRAFRYGNVVKPSRDWFLLLGLAALLALASIIWNMWTFNRIAAGEILGTPVVTMDTETNDAFSQVKKQFDLRAAAANRYVFEYHFIDPSRE